MGIDENKQIKSISIPILEQTSNTTFFVAESEDIE